MSVSASRPRRIVLGVSGGIAAYKAAEIVRALTGAGVDVQVVMTDAAREFVGPLTFQALTGRVVRDALFDPAAEAAMGHIELARWADLILIAPATADVMARLATGQADDLLTTAVLATAAPVAVAPAMNQQMWAAPATRRNLAVLQADGVLVWGPGDGDQACGDVGPGRMLEPAELARRALATLAGQPATSTDAALAGLTVLVTAGPTREPIDPVRYISNQSSGKQGFAVAAAAAAAGARVILVSGPVDLPTPAGVERVDVVSARDMLAACEARVPDCQIVVAVAAVADYRAAEAAEHKIKKATDDNRRTLELVENPDIIATLARHGSAPFCVGFAAETRDVVAYARDKLARKGLQMIVANDVSDSAIGFGSDNNAATVLWEGGQCHIGPTGKDVLAMRLVELIAERYRHYGEQTPAAATTATQPRDTATDSRA